ncbi:MAG: CaiB/BaiF CoA-transferase family protein [Pseudomonadota bacterium]
MTGPFSGLRVIDFTHVLAGPACAYYLGLLGADVIKVESAARGDAMRYRGGTDRARADSGMSTAFLTQGAGKKSVAIDLSQGPGRSVFYKLIASADILVENHLPQTLKDLSLGEADLRILNPRLIHCAMTGYGRGGDRQDAPAYDVNIQAASGLMSLTGTDGTGPLRTGAPVMDYATALAAAFAISAALHQRNQSGEGSFIDVSMLETAFVLMSSTVADYLTTGSLPKPRGNAANSRSPAAGSFACKDGILSLGVNEDHQFAALAETVGRPEWVSDIRFSTRAARRDHADELKQALCARLTTRTAEEWESALTENGVPAARLRTLPESLALHQVEARRFLHSDALTGAITPTLPFRIGPDAVHAPRSTTPNLGAHTREVLRSLGYADAEIAEFERQGAVRVHDDVNDLRTDGR